MLLDLIIQKEDAEGQDEDAERSGNAPPADLVQA